jgi:hypothetical protein
LALMDDLGVTTPTQFRERGRVATQTDRPSITDAGSPSTMGAMPRLSAFYGIVIYMYRPDHPPPHFHAQYGEHVAQLDLTSLEVLNGSLPARALRLVREWAELHRDELAMNWDLAQALEPLVEIDPLP